MLKRNQIKAAGQYDIDDAVLQLFLQLMKREAFDVQTGRNIMFAQIILLYSERNVPGWKNPEGL